MPTVSSIWNWDLSLRRAFGASLVLHGLFALFFPLFATSPDAGSQPFQRISFVHVARVAVAPIPRSGRLPAAMHQMARPHLGAKHARPRSNRIARVRLKVGSLPAAFVGAEGRTPASSAAQPYATPLSSAGDRPSPKETGVPDAAAGVGAPNSAGKKDVGGVMPFGADLPEPVLDPKVRAELVHRFASVHVTLIVTVGDDGRTKNVEFHPPLEPRVQAEISALLAAANWDAAVCGGGIPCAGRTTITL